MKRIIRKSRRSVRFAGRSCQLINPSRIIIDVCKDFILNRMSSFQLEIWLGHKKVNNSLIEEDETNILSTAQSFLRLSNNLWN